MREAQLTPLLRIIREPREAQRVFSAEQHHAVYRACFILEFMTRRWTNMSHTPEFLPAHGAIRAGLGSLYKSHSLANELDANFTRISTLPRRVRRATKKGEHVGVRRLITGSVFVLLVVYARCKLDG